MKRQQGNNFRRSLAVISYISALALVSTGSSAGLMDLGFDAGAHWGIGTMKNSTKSIQSRTVNTLGMFVMPQYRFMGFGFGPYFEYQIVGQNTDPASVGGTNLKGSGYLLGFGVNYNMGPFYATGVFDFLGQHKLSKNDTSGNEVKYKKPIGFQLKAGYEFIPMWTADFMWTLVSYKESMSGSTVADISNDKLSHMDFSLGASFHY